MKTLAPITSSIYDQKPSDSQTKSPHFLLAGRILGTPPSLCYVLINTFVNELSIGSIILDLNRLTQHPVMISTRSFSFLLHF